MPNHIKNLIGLKFNKLTVLEHVGSSRGAALWKCKCDCGNEIIKEGRRIKGGRVKSCGCLILETLKESRKLNWKMREKSPIPPNRKFGRLLVLGPKRSSKRGEGTAYLCRCDCGKENWVIGRRLHSGGSQSCGCIIKELNKKRFTKHGLSYTKVYKRVLTQKRRELEKKLDPSWTPEMDMELRKIQNRCILCNKRKDLTVDHVFPLSKGFGLKPGNAIILCRKCNCHKHNKFPDQLDISEQKKILSSAKSFQEYWELKNEN